MKTRTKVGLLLQAVNVGTSALALGISKVHPESKKPMEQLVTETFNRMVQEHGIEDAELEFGSPHVGILDNKPLAYVLRGGRKMYFCIDEKELTMKILTSKLPKHIFIDVVVAHELAHIVDDYTKGDNDSIDVTVAEKRAWEIGKGFTRYPAAYNYFNFQNMIPYWGKDAISKLVK